MVHLDATLCGTDVLISQGSFEHLLSCLDNQKFIGDINADAMATMSDQERRDSRNERQAAIDDFNAQCRRLLHPVVAAK